jgi:hypothetical protein
MYKALLFTGLMALMLSCGQSEKEQQQLIIKTMDSIKRATAIHDSIVLDSIRRESYDTEKRRGGRLEYNNSRHQLDNNLR